MSAQALRVVFRAALDGRVFKVQRNQPLPSGVANWRTFDGYTNLRLALKRYPSAEPHHQTRTRQSQLENQPHPFERANDPAADPECFHCGREFVTPAHGKGLAEFIAGGVR